MMPTQEEEYDRFVRDWPAFESTRAIDDLRAREFSRLDASGHVYLDYTGAGLGGASQVRRHLDLLLGNVLGNPHSGNPASKRATALVDQARRHVLAFFG